jgi:hypothetical protein
LSRQVGKFVPKILFTGSIASLAFVELDLIVQTNLSIFVQKIKDIEINVFCNIDTV